MRPIPTAAMVAWDALVAAGKTALPTVQVLDGPPLDQPLEPELFIVGHSDGTAPAVLITSDLHRDAAQRRREEGDIVCVLSSWNGDADMKAARARCLDMYNGLDLWLRANPGIGGTVDGAWIGEETQWLPRQSPDGAFCNVGFTVHYVAEI